MLYEHVFTQMAVVLALAAVVGVLALWLRQPLIVAFILVGILVGPVGFDWISSEQFNLLAAEQPSPTVDIVKREIDALYGRIALGILIIQDIVVVLLMLGLAAWGKQGAGTSLGLEVLAMIAKGAGFLLLTLTLASGTLFAEALFHRPLVINHHIVLSLTGWVIFGILLLGHWRYGWRGRHAVRWTLGGFALLLLGYFGTKFVLEILLGR